MIQLTQPEYGVTECAETYKKVKITATLEKYIEVPDDADIEDAVDNAIDHMDLGDFDFDYDIIGEHTENVYVRV